MQDNVTSGEIVESFSGGLRRLLRLADNPVKLETYIRRSIARGDYFESIRACDTPAWERAFAHVIAIQDFVRMCDGRVEDGRLAFSVPPAPSEEHQAYLRALAETDLGYVHDPSWTNGGLASHGAELEVDDPNEKDPLKRIRRVAPLQGVAVFGKVVQLDGVPEIAWNYSAGAFELGISSIHDGMVAKMLLGDAMGRSAVCAEEPTDNQVHAATIQRRVLNQLRKLAPHQQANLELAYTDRRYTNDLVIDYGLGLAPIVWRAAHRAGEIDARGCVMPGAGTLRELVDEARKDWPTYDPPARGTLKKRILRAADLILWTAHAFFNVAGQKAPDPRRQAKKRALAALATRKDQKRKKTRRLVPAHRRAA